MIDNSGDLRIFHEHYDLYLCGENSSTLEKGHDASKSNNSVH